MLNVGDKVKIESKFHGIYDGRTGIVVENNPNVWYVRVIFDEPIMIDNLKISEEVFYPSELHLIS